MAPNRRNSGFLNGVCLLPWRRHERIHEGNEFQFPELNLRKLLSRYNIKKTATINQPLNDTNFANGTDIIFVVSRITRLIYNPTMIAIASPFSSGNRVVKFDELKLVNILFASRLNILFKKKKKKKAIFFNKILIHTTPCIKNWKIYFASCFPPLVYRGHDNRILSIDSTFFDCFDAHVSPRRYPEYIHWINIREISKRESKWKNVVPRRMDDIAVKMWTRISWPRLLRLG